MYIFNRLTIVPKLPDRIRGIHEIAENLWWCWNTESLKLFKKIDKELWERVEKNPIKFLKQISQTKLEEVAKDEEFLREYNKVYLDFKGYMENNNTYYMNNYEKYKNKCIAYFSAEYGLDETMPLYSGGLGILSGDHLKSASDLGIPLVGVGLMYKEGYFNQKIDGRGNQLTLFAKSDLDNMPIKKVKDEKGRDLAIYIDIENNKVMLKVWVINVGRVKLYLLDSDTEENSSKYRELSYRLYGGGREMRLMQEMILGIGGVKLLKALNIRPNLYHMNEGHSAFLIVELIEEIMREKQVSFEVAKELVKTMTAVTVHTPVPAGNEIFDIDLIEKMFDGKWDDLGISKDTFLGLGMTPNDNYKKAFNMGVFALKIAGKKNGVSKLHRRCF